MDGNRARIDEVKRRASRPLVTVFGDSASEEGSGDYALARSVGRMLAEAGYGVVNGGYGGTMAASARGVREAGGLVIGVTIAGAKWTPNPWLTEELPASDALDRLQTMVKLGEAYVVLPGGTGTLLELAYVWEALNKRWLSPRPLILYGEGWAVVAKRIIAQQPRAGQWVTLVSSLEEMKVTFRALGSP